MKSLRQLKKRIKSVKNTAKITNALEMVSISKMKLFQSLANTSLAYANDIAVLAALITKNVTEDYSGLSKKTVKHYFEERSHDKPAALVLYAPTRGFCGSLITEMLNMLSKELDKTKAYAGIGLQKKSKYILSKFTNINIETIFDTPIEKTDFNAISTVYEYVMKNYFAGKYSKILLVYSHFGGSFNYKPIVKQILPLQLDEIKKYVNTPEEEQLINQTFTFEPNKEKLILEILDRYIKTMFLYTLISAKASEHNARMIAMKNATDNANSLKDTLNLEYNKSRQETITSELLDIIGGKIKT